MTWSSTSNNNTADNAPNTTSRFGTNECYGSSENGTAESDSANVSIWSRGSKTITITQTTWFKLLHIAGQHDSQGFGIKVDNSSHFSPRYTAGKNIYAEVIIQDLATAVATSPGPQGIQGNHGSATTGIIKIATIEHREDSTVGDLAAINSNTWTTRKLTHKTDPQNFVTFPEPSDNSNTKTVWSLPAGTYRIKWSAPMARCDRHQSKLVYSVNSTFGSYTSVEGSSELIENAANLVATRSLGETVLTLTQKTWFRIQHMADGPSTGTVHNFRGASTANIFSGNGATDAPTWSVFTQVSIQDLATAVASTSTGTTKIATVKDVKDWDENGGSFTPNTWIHRDLNTLSDPNNIGLSISGNIVAVPAGTYKFRWRAPGYHCNRFTSRLAYSTHSTLASGVTRVTGETSDANADHNAFGYSEGLIASLTFSATNYIKIEQWSDTGYTVGGSNSTGLGVNSSIDGSETGSGGNDIDSVYTVLEIEDLATRVAPGATGAQGIQGQTGSAGTGKVINVWTDRRTTALSTQNTSWQNISGLDVTVTPASSNSKFLIMANVTASHSNPSGHDGLVRLAKTVSGTTSGLGNGTGGTNTTTDANQGFLQVSGQNSHYELNHGATTYLDAPGNTNQITYRIQFRSCNADHTMYINQRGAIVTDFRTPSSITVMELSS